MRNSSLLAFAAVVGLGILTGCHSAYVEATISNRSADTLSLVELDYPSASFGTQTLPAGADFHYRFKVLGSGATALIWTDAGHHEHKDAGPGLKEGDEGTLAVTFRGAGPVWETHLVNR